MNRQRSIVLFAAIATIAMTTIGLSGVSATPLMVSSVPTSQEGMGMLGHVEYTVMDSENNVVQYLQGDNIVVHSGKDCTVRLLFGAGDDLGVCDETTPLAFNYIAIGNGTTSEAVDDTELSSAGASICADTGGGQEGEMARKLATVTITTAAATTAGTVVELVTPNPFTFAAGVNATNTVEQSGLFNGISTDDTLATYDGGSGNGECQAPGAAGTDWQMFSIKDLNTGSGIAVTDGDSLSVKWTITVGGP